MKQLSFLFYLVALPFLTLGFLIIGMGQVITGRIPAFNLLGYRVREERSFQETALFEKARAEAEFLKRISDGVIAGEIKPRAVRYEEIKEEEAKEEAKAEIKKRVRRTKAEIQVSADPAIAEAAPEVPQDDIEF